MKFDSVRIYFSRYELKKKNSMSAGDYQPLNSACVGALFKAEFVRSEPPEGRKTYKGEPDGGAHKIVSSGYSALQPWPELGDRTLEFFLEAVRSGIFERFKNVSSNSSSASAPNRLTPDQVSLISEPLRFCEMDARARLDSIDLLADKKFSKSHFTITDSREINRKSLCDIVELGFDTLKVKVSPQNAGDVLANFRGTADEVEFMADSDPGIEGGVSRNIGRLRWRFDANSSFEFEKVEKFLTSLKQVFEESEIGLVDFIEDPCPFDFSLWSHLNGILPVAIDFEWKNFEHQNEKYASLGEPKSLPFNYLIVKPIRQNVSSMLRALDKRIGGQFDREKIVFTSSMDHPLGQTQAAYFESSIGKNSRNGLNSHIHFEENEYSKSWRKPFELSPNFPLQEEKGIGFGFDNLLASENWEFLSEWTVEKWRGLLICHALSNLQGTEYD